MNLDDLLGPLFKAEGLRLDRYSNEAGNETCWRKNGLAVILANKNVVCFRAVIDGKVTVAPWTPNQWPVVINMALPNALDLIKEKLFELRNAKVTFISHSGPIEC